MKKIHKIACIVIVLIAVAIMAVSLTGCRQSYRVAYNVSKEADNFNVTRKLTVMNALHDSVMMEMTGTFSISNNSVNELEIICKTGPDEYKKHFVYLNQFTIYTVEDISGADVDEYKYEVTLFPQMVPVADWEIDFG